MTKTDLRIYESFGETSETMTTLTQLQNARERLTDSYSRLNNLLLRVYESQPEVPSDLLELFSNSMEQARLTADAIEATVKETYRDWNLL